MEFFQRSGGAYLAKGHSPLDSLIFPPRIPGRKIGGGRPLAGSQRLTASPTVCFKLFIFLIPFKIFCIKKATSLKRWPWGIKKATIQKVTGHKNLEKVLLL